MRKFFFTVCLLVFGTFAKAQSLRVGVTSATLMPWSEILTHQGKERVVQGVIRDFAEQLAEELKTTVEFRVFPRFRIENGLSSGEVDIVCNMRPEWTKEEFLWSENMANNGIRLIWSAHAKPVKKIEELRGKKILTVKGYQYPVIEKALGEGFVREDNEDQSKALQRLLVGDFDYALIGRVALDYIKLSKLERKRLSSSVLVLDDQPVGCAISKKTTRFQPEKIKDAADALIKKGAVKKIFQFYGVNP